MKKKLFDLLTYTQFKYNKQVYRITKITTNIVFCKNVETQEIVEFGNIEVETYE